MRVRLLDESLHPICMNVNSSFFPLRLAMVSLLIRTHAHLPVQERPRSTSPVTPNNTARFIALVFLTFFDPSLLFYRFGRYDQSHFLHTTDKLNR